MRALVNAKAVKQTMPIKRSNPHLLKARKLQKKNEIASSMHNTSDL